MYMFCIFIQNQHNCFDYGFQSVSVVCAPAAQQFISALFDIDIVSLLCFFFRCLILQMHHLLCSTSEGLPFHQCK